MWWLGQNCWNISVYVRDARTQELPLVGGGEHDWASLLSQWGWLEQDQAIGGAVYLAGVIWYAVSVVGGWLLLRQPRLEPQIPAGPSGRSPVGPPGSQTHARGQPDVT